MFASNAHYGHRSVLTAYAQVPPTTPLPGLLEHGWNHDLGAALFDIVLPAPDPFYVWNERNLRHCKKSNVAHVASFGAPYLYLPPLPPAAPEPKSLLAIPVHGWEKLQISHDYQAYAAALVKLRGEFSRITVCLYWYDHQFAANREIFTSQGMDVVTVGHRDHNPQFLPAMRDLLRRHAFCTSNRIQTGLFYALHERLPAFLYGPPMGIDAIYDHSGHVWDAWQRQQFPQLVYEAFAGQPLPELAAAELGAAFFRTPQQLRQMLLWQPDQAPLLAQTVARHHIRQSRGLQRRWHQLTGRLAAAAQGPSPALAAAHAHGAFT